MKVSREQVAENRQKILCAAGRMFRARGFDSVTVAEIMKDAGLTHGAFYGYFKSKEDLIAQTLAHALTPAASDVDLLRYAAKYLSPDHRDNLEGGCPTAALCAEAFRQGPEAKAAMTEGLKQQIERLAQGAPGAKAAEKRRNAIGSWSAMVGAMMLSRLSDDPKLSEEVLAETRNWIRAQDKNR
jgi:TetR/AcrR family transcriptional repressor of nem operon